MTTRPREIPTLTDPLGETLHLLRLNGSFYCRSELTAPWGVEMPAFDGYMMFHIVTAGHCWLEVEGEAPRLLQQGSLTLVPRGNGHRIRSSPEVTVEPLFEIPVERVSERYEVMRYGGGGAPTQLTCGVVSFDHQAGQQLIAQLPGLLQIDSLNDEDDSWLQSSLRFIAREARELRPGGETVITHLLISLSSRLSAAGSIRRPKPTGAGWPPCVTIMWAERSRQSTGNPKKTGPWPRLPGKSVCRDRDFPPNLPN